MLTAEQVIFVGIAASVLTEALRFLANKFEVYPTGVAKNIILFGASVGLAAAFGLPEVPSGDPIVFATGLLEAALQVVGVASLAYNLLLEKVVFPKIGLG